MKLTKIKSLRKRFSKLRGTSSHLKYQSLRDDLVMFKYFFHEEFYVPAENNLDDAQFKLDFAALKIKADIAVEKEQGAKIPNIREETSRRTKDFAKELLKCKKNFRKLKPIHKLIESMENSIASHLR